MPTNLALAALAFVLAHRVISGSRLRDRIARRLGERTFQAAFSLLSAVLTAWLVVAYLTAGTGQPTSSIFARCLAIVLSLPASYLVVAGLTTRNPTIAGLGNAVHDEQSVHGVIRLTRHPFLVGVVLLATAHLLLLHALTDWIFFGTLAFVALTGMPSVDMKRRRALGAAWEAFRRATSIVPGLAIIRGRQTVSFQEIGYLRPLGGLLLFIAALLLHPH